MKSIELQRTGQGARAFMQGRDGCSLSAGLQWDRMPFSCLVAVAGCTSDGCTKPKRHISDFSSLGGDGKGSPGSHCDSPNMRASASKRLWDNCSHQIAGLIPEVALVSLAVTEGQADLAGVAHPTMAVSCRFDQQREHLRCVQRCRRRGSNAGSIQPVGFRQVLLRSVVLRAPA